MSLSSSAVRMMLRPMRPKPLMPTFMGITSCDEGVGTCIGFALAVRFRTRRSRPFDPSLDFSSCTWAHLLLRVSVSCLPNSRTDRPTRDSSGERVPAGAGRTVRPCELLVRADAAVAFERLAHAHGALLGGHDRFAFACLEYLAARHAGHLFCVLPLVRQCRTGFLRLSVRWNVAGSGVPCDVFCAGRFSAWLGRRKQTFACEPLPAGMGMLPDLFRIGGGEDPGRRSAVAEFHRA